MGLKTQRSYEGNLIFFFKKPTCCQCGKKMSRKTNIREVKKGQPEFDKDTLMGYNPFLSKREIVTFSFYCNFCNIGFSDDGALKIRKLQKSQKTKILPLAMYQDFILK